MISDIKDLKALFKLCRNQGVTAFKMNGIEVSFGDLPIKGSSMEVDDIESPELTDEDLIFYSSERGQDVIDKKVGMR